MQPYHQNNQVKDFEKRSEVESKKVKNLAGAFEKMKKSLDVEKKAYCIELKKGVDQYAATPYLTPGLSATIKEFSGKLEKNAPVYTRAMDHIQDVSCNALGYLPKKYEQYKKSIKLMEKQPNDAHKLKDFEYERIQYTRQALLHYFNAQMLVHANMFQLYAETFEKLEALSDGDEVLALYENAPWVKNELSNKGIVFKK
ncbi:UNKNOWN [Stylonychia lemnae]|uniref:BAR domain-containing protein n=1 Tax=Stylonychia lemnae TaxID=5949 RepID=A0A078A790_STYLE|nr:UNKNOWN [Stylonychia lemnae]|eukprot:CDW77392.1 UNKNOWN [Stylonychia lemnae]